MKKTIFILIFLTLMLFKVNVSADSYTTDENSSEYEYVSVEELNEGKLIKSNLNLIAPSENYYINNIYYNNEVYIVVGYVITDSGDNTYSGYPFVSYYKDYALKWSIIFNNDGHGEFNNIVILNDFIYLSGNVEKSMVIKPYLAKLDENGGIYLTKVYNCNKNTSISYMFSAYNELYLIGITTATNIDNITFDNEYNRIVYLKVNEQLGIKDYCLIGNNKNNTIYNVICKNDNFYLFGTTGGEGELNISSDNQTFIYIFSIFGDYVNHYKVNNVLSGFTDIVVHNKDVYLINKAYDSNSIDIYSEYYEIMQKKGTIKLSQGDENIKKMFFKVYNDYLLVFEVISKNGSDIMRVSYMQETVEKVIEISLHSICSIKNIIYNNDLFLYFGNTLENNIYKPFAAEVIYLEIKNGKVYINNMEISEIINATSNDKYGKYNAEVKYTYNDVNLYMKKEIIVPLEINLKNKEIYDIGMKIESNADVYINNVLVENGYEFTEEGDYLLEIRGGNIETVYLIKIRNLRNSIIIKDNNELKYEFQESNITKMNEVVYMTNSSVEKINANQIIIASILLIGIIGFMAGFLLPIKKGKKA